MKGGNEKKAVTFGDWEAKIREGKIPIPIFNCTVAETGERLLLAPVGVPGPD